MVATKGDLGRDKDGKGMGGFGAADGSISGNSEGSMRGGSDNSDKGDYSDKTTALKDAEPSVVKGHEKGWGETIAEVVGKFLGGGLGSTFGGPVGGMAGGYVGGKVATAPFQGATIINTKANKGYGSGLILKDTAPTDHAKDASRSEKTSGLLLGDPPTLNSDQGEMPGKGDTAQAPHVIKVPRIRDNIRAQIMRKYNIYM